MPKYEDDKKVDKIYTISQCDFDEINKYFGSFDDDVLLLDARLSGADMGLETIRRIKKKDKNFIKIAGDKQNFKSSKNALRTLHSFYKSNDKKLKEIRELNDEIIHYENFIGTLDESLIESLNKKIKELVQNAKKSKSSAELLDDFMNKKISKEEYLGLIGKSVNLVASVYNYELDASLKEHYYCPLILANGGNKINYAIKDKSEIEFLNDLKDNKSVLESYQWCFSRLAQNVDQIYIPYFDEVEQKFSNFYPDFIFWLKKDNKYFIIFIDPKGLSHEANPKSKINGFEAIFDKKSYKQDGLEIFVKLFYYNKDMQPDLVLAKYTKSNIDEIFGTL